MENSDPTGSTNSEEPEHFHTNAHHVKQPKWKRLTWMTNKSASSSFKSPQMLVFILLFVALGSYVIYRTFAAKPTPQQTTSQTLSSNVTQNWRDGSNIYQYLTTNGCFGVDTIARWNGVGTLAPGESYTFNPTYPTCGHNEAARISMHADWSGATQLRLETNLSIPPADTHTFKNSYLGRNIVAPIMAAPNGRQQTNLCLLSNIDSSSSPVNWSMTITNTGTQTATVNLTGAETNGWVSYVYPDCIRADADNDHWNDSLEHAMMVLGNNRTTSNITPGGSIWLEGSGFKTFFAGTQAERKIAASPADINSDGVVDQSDVDYMQPFVGQGNGRPLDQISPNNNIQRDNILLWRRYDLDGDGRVTQHDVSEVQQLVGKALPLTADYLAPWAVISSPATAPAGSSFFSIDAFASDNDLLTHVDFYAGSKLLCSYWGSASNPGEYPMFSCGWKTVPRQAGVATTITVKAYDNSGKSYTTTQTVTTQ